MASLQLFMLRMHLLDSSSPYRTAKRRRRFSSSATLGTCNLADLNNNYSLSQIIQPSLKRHRVSAFVYQTCPTLEGGPKSEAPSQLAVHVFEGLDVKLRSEQSISLSVEKFLSFRRFSSAVTRFEDAAVISGVYISPRMVPVSCVSTVYPCFNTETGARTMVYRTTVEWRRRYHTVAHQTINEEQQEVDRESSNYVSHACWIISDIQNN